MELLLGCGREHSKRMVPPGGAPGWTELVTADIDPATAPDMVVDLDTLKWRHAFSEFPLFDEIHAYEVLEHLGWQGDALGFFSTFYNCWSLLKPGGYLLASVPSRFSPWLWGDPGHRRAIVPESLTFLVRPEYARQRGRTPMSDYSGLWHGDFDIVESVDDRRIHRFCLRAVKPVRAYHETNTNTERA